MVNEPWPHRLLSDHGAPARIRISKVRGPLSWCFSLPMLLMLRPVSGDGLRAVDLSREFARHRSVPTFSRWKAIPHGVARQDIAHHSSRRQRVPRLADLRRFRSDLNRYSATAVPARSHRLGPGSKPLRFGLDHYRSMPVAVPVGQVS